MHACTAFAVAWQQTLVTVGLTLVLCPGETSNSLGTYEPLRRQLSFGFHLEPVQESQDAFVFCLRCIALVALMHLIMRVGAQLGG